MGTHPIFESDFDCLTDVNKIRREIGPSEGFVLSSKAAVDSVFSSQWLDSALRLSNAH